MGRRVINQGDGLFAIWSTVVDDFLAEDLTEDEVKKLLLKWRKKEIKKEIDEIFEFKRYSNDYNKLLEQRRCMKD